MTEPTSDDDLIRRHQDGDGKALHALCVRHRQYAYALCRRMLGDHHAAEDASQEAFLKAFAGLGSFRREVPFRAWFRRILVNVCLNWRRTRQRRGTVPLEVDPPTDDPPSAVELTELQVRLRQAINELPEKQRAVLVLRSSEGLEMAEIADLLGTSAQNVRTNLFLARRTLREQLAGLADEVP